MCPIVEKCVVVLIHTVDQTAPSGYEWISSGMENELCITRSAECTCFDCKLKYECYSAEGCMLSFFETSL